MTRDRRIVLYVALAGLPGAAVALRLLWLFVPSQALRWTLAAVILGSLAGFALLLQALIVRPLQTLSNMLAAVREGDYTLRSRGAFPDDALGAAMLEANAIAEALRGQRLDSLEATALLGSVMDEIEVAVLAFDPEGRVRFSNRAAALLFLTEPALLHARLASQLGLAEALLSTGPRTMDLAFPGGMGRWEVRARDVRLGGAVHRLVVLSDLRRALREEERQAWQRLIRVLGHEINNSLTPIQSIAQSLLALVAADARSGSPDAAHAGTRGALQEDAASAAPAPDPVAGLREDLRAGLSVIAARADAVARFMASYARLARLPLPRLQPLDVAQWVGRVAALETRARVVVKPGPAVTLDADGDQLDQALINLVANAVEAGGGAAISWAVAGRMLEVTVTDAGPGLPASANLFTPFFTTKKGGSGIGLVLSRQIAENHGGSLALHDRSPGPGCEARLRLPLR